MKLVKLFILVLCVSLLCSCSESNSQAKLRTINAQVKRQDQTLAHFVLEVADTPELREKGLMYRTSMSEQEGMVFVYNDQSLRTFWMKNTYISLDMVFIDTHKKIVGILENVPVMNEDPRSVDKPAQYIVELVAGTSKKNNISVGDIFQFDGL